MAGRLQCQLRLTPVVPVEAPILHRFGKMLGRHCIRLVQIGDSPRQLEYPVDLWLCGPYRIRDDTTGVMTRIGQDPSNRPRAADLL